MAAKPDMARIAMVPAASPPAPVLGTPVVEVPATDPVVEVSVVAAAPVEPVDPVEPVEPVEP